MTGGRCTMIMTKLDEMIGPEEPFQPILYFGYGAMTNSISRGRRNISSVNERAAVLPNFEIVFRHGGAASVNPCEGKEVHGVVMELSSMEDWQRLKATESGYEIVQEYVMPYGMDKPVLAYMFRFVPKENQDEVVAIPQERYLKVISMGLRENGVEEHYIQNEILGIKSIPSAKPEEWLTMPFADSACSAKMTWDEYQHLCMKKPCFLIGRKIVQCKDLDATRFWSWMKTHMLGKPDSTWPLVIQLLDPDMPFVETREELTELHERWAEHQVLLFLAQSGLDAEPTVIAFLRDCPGVMRD